MEKEKKVRMKGEECIYREWMSEKKVWIAVDKQYGPRKEKKRQDKREVRDK